MKVLMISTFDVNGGAAIAAYRLHRGLLDQGVESKMLVQRKDSNDPTVEEHYSDSLCGSIYSKLRPLINNQIIKLQNSTNTTTHSTNILPSGLHRAINQSDADIVHLHWINWEMISIREISKINKPIVWTFHDMWAFSGAEHYDDLDEPGRYKKGYSKDNRPKDYSGLDIDLWTWKRKMNNWKGKNFNIVTPSRWLRKCAGDSVLFRDQQINRIPNGIDLDIYKPIPKEWASKILNIPKSGSKKNILFGAISATKDPRKGYKQLQKTLKILKKDNCQYQLIVFGSDGNNGLDFGLPTTYLGKLKDKESLVLAYTSADVMIVPSLQDNLPNTAVEAIACGTPVASFDIGGLSDIIEHKRNGYLAEAYNSADLAKGIKWIVSDKDSFKKLSEEARRIAEKKFDISKVSKKYISFYKNVKHRSK